MPVLRILLALILSACTHNNSYIGGEYLGAKYIADPLGEEKSPDPDPLIRYDAFDCTTFVETSLSHGDLSKLNKIRYSGDVPDFMHRNHFIEADWIADNSDIVKNVSYKYGKTQTRNIIIDRANWLYKVHNIRANIAPENVSIEYIPYNQWHNQTPEKELIVLFIADNSEKVDTLGTDLAVVHMGFLLPNGMLRHASSEFGRVMDTDMAQYVQRKMKNKNNLGLTLLEINDDAR